MNVDTKKKLINWEAWACQLFFGYPLGMDTYFEGEIVQRVTLPIQPVTLSSTSEPISDFSEAVDTSVSLLHESMEIELQKYSNSEPIMFLSGGWDSRALICALKNVKPKIKVKAYTTSYDSGNNKEEVFASNVAKVLNVPHKIISLSDSYYEKVAFESILACDFSTPMHVWMAEFMNRLKLNRDVVNFDGYAGDIIFRGMRQHIGDENLSADDPLFFKRFAVLHPETILTGPVYKTLEKLARKALARELSRYPPETRMMNFLLNNRGCRGIAHSIGVQRNYINVSLPFLNDKLLQNTINIDPHIRLDPRFYPAILENLNSRVAILPSTNCNPPNDEKIQNVPQIKYSENNLSWIMSNFKSIASNGDTAGGLIDWYTLTPERIVNQKRSGRELAWHLRSLEHLNVYSLWYEHYRKDLCPKHNLLKDSYDSSSDYLEVKLPKQNVDYDGIIQEYQQKISELDNNKKLFFNFTMDVEAFGIGDYFASHTASDDNIIDRMIYSNFGNGSNIKKYLIDKKIPCTYFIESYSDTWKDELEFKNAVDFFSTKHSEVGLHCHAFSIPANLKRELKLDYDWAFKPNQLFKVISWGKKRLDTALGNSVPVNSYRSGRLDVYPEMEAAIQAAGFSIDSSLIDGVDRYHYEERTISLGNGMFEYNGLTQIPITSYKVGKRTSSFTFNPTGFEDMCKIIFQALQDELPSLTMLSHSWSFGRVAESSSSGKKFHIETEPLLIEKFNKLMEFINNVPSIQLSSLTNTAKELKGAPSSRQPASNLNTKPELLKVEIIKTGNQIVATSKPNTSRIKGELEYAFYLIHTGEKLDKRLYTTSNEVCFDIPTLVEYSDLLVRAFIRIKGENKPHFAKSVSVSTE